MKFMNNKTILRALTILSVIICSLTLTNNALLKSKRNNNKWLADWLFKWNRGSVVIENGPEKMSFEGEINYNPRGVYFTDIKGKTDFLRDFSYAESGEGKTASVIDYAVIVDCDVKKNDKNGLSFKLRKYYSESNKQKKNYMFNINYSSPSAFFGSFDTDKTIEKIKENCTKRQEEIKKQFLQMQKLAQEKLEQAKLLMQKGLSLFENIKKDATEIVNSVSESAKKSDEDFQDKFLNALEKANKHLEKSTKDTIKPKVDEVKITEDPKVTNILESEKEIVQIQNKSIEIKYDTGYGLGLFITGNQEYLGNWKKMIPLRIEGKDHWKFSSELLKNGDEFKIVLHYYSDKTIDLAGKEENQAKIDPKKAESFPNLVVYEKPDGSAGNKKVKLIDNVMKHQPKFSIKK